MVPEKVPVEQLVTVRVPMSVPTEPLTVTVLAELIVRFDDTPPVVPEILDRLTVPAPLLVSVSAALSASVKAARVMFPVPVAIEAVPLEVVAPRVIALLVEAREPFSVVVPV